ncbi:MAG: class I SAM-dependent methyltransferase [Gemmatimonadetes bacterium]|nr:class I SAM-dependent methyltransferase [Gemmatimonadota bacterium]
MTQGSGAAPGEWFREWFGEAYLRLYPHRDEREAAQAVELYLTHAKIGPGRRVLDLACGAGRHLQVLLRERLAVYGMDLSAPLLHKALPDGRGRLTRGDMRKLPYRSGAFEGLVSFFTSFGYFMTPEEDRDVLSEARRVLARGSWILLDYLNEQLVRSTLAPQDEQRVGDNLVRQRRWIENEQVFKQIDVGAPDGGVRTYHERVRLYQPSSLKALFRECGFTPRLEFGHYDGSNFGSSSPRFILMATAE